MTLASLCLLLAAATSVPEVRHVPLPAEGSRLAAIGSGVVVGAGDAGVWLYDEASARVRWLASHVGAIGGLAVAGGVVYWTVSEAPSRHPQWLGVWRLGKDGSAAERVAVSPAPGAIAAAAKQLVWLDGGATLKDDGAVLIANQDEPHSVRAVARGQSDPWTLRLVDQVVYWSTCGSSMSRPLGPKTGALWMASTNGKSRRRLLAGLRCPALAGREGPALIFLDEGRLQSVVPGHPARTLWRAAGRHIIDWVSVGEDGLALVGDDAREEGERTGVASSGALIRFHRGEVTTVVGSLSHPRALVADGTRVRWIDDQGLATLTISPPASDAGGGDLFGGLLGSGNQCIRKDIDAALVALSADPRQR